jgi:ATP-dependent DNA ligase
MSDFKPQLLPNNKAGEAPNWEERIAVPEEWLYSNKLDGARVEIFASGVIKGRSLKVIPNVHIKQMGKDIMDVLQLHEGTILEGEFWAPGMTFSEIMHFFKTEDVTSEKSKQKYLKLWQKTGGNPEKGWTYPGRDCAWLTTWHPELQFHLFGIANTHFTNVPFTRRVDILEGIVDDYNDAMKDLPKDMVMIQQNTCEHIDQIYQAYDQSIMNGYEGLVLMHGASTYKYGRHTLNAKQAFKIKDDNLHYDGQVLEVEESTIAIEGAPKSTNELGRSVRSKLQEHREPSGMAKGFKVLLDDGQTMSVSLTGFDHPDRIKLLNQPQEYVGKWIRFTAMAPVKIGGRPRGPAHYTKGNVRDCK